MEDIKFSEWALLRRHGGRRLVVGFSAANTPAGKFRFYTAVMSEHNDALLFNIPKNDWYMNGVPLENGSPSMEQTLALIRGVAAGYDEIFFLGGSMGGYAALLYGSKFAGAEILAMGPEVYPGLRGGFYAMQKINATPPNLSYLFADPDFRPWIVAGEKKASDLFCLTEVASDRVVTLRNFGHFVPAVIHNLAGSMAGVIERLYAGELGDVVGERRGELHEWPDVTNLLYLFAIGRVSMDRLVQYMRAVPEDFYGRGYMALAIAKRAFKRGNAKRALRFAESAAEVNPGDLEAQLWRDRLTLEVRGSLPSPRFEAVVDPAYLTDVAYRGNYDSLCELHGVPSAYEHTASARF